MDLNTVFQANPRSIERVVAQPARGFYIPSYQRPYAWKPNDVRSLITSIVEGLSAMVSMNDAITFVGTFIFINDTDYTTVEPQVRDDLPTAVYLVIDGQQRLTTFTLIGAALHERLLKLQGSTKLPDGTEEWLRKQVSILSTRIRRMLVLDMDFGEAEWRLYPRIIRAYDDSWSLDASKAKYSSAVAAFLRRHICSSILSNEAKASDAADTNAVSWQLLERNSTAVQKELRRLSEAKVKADSDELLPELSTIGDSKDLQVRFFGGEVPSPVLEVWARTDPKLHDRRLQQLSRLVMFGRYLLDRVAVTEVLVNKEEYAFDMFEALNATGEPLTAYETFKPRVISCEGLDGYKSSPSAGHLGIVERFLDADVENRQKASNQLLIPFALFERGYKLSKHLREQRNWLRRQYDDAAGDTARRDFLRGLAAVAQFLMDGWHNERAEFGGPLSLLLGKQHAADAEALLCLEVLRAASHDITIGVLARYYAEVLWAKEGERDAALAEFVGAAKAVTAFFALWRGSRPTTEGIDSVYRNLMRLGGPGISPLSRASGKLPDALKLQAYFRAKLAEKGISGRDDWAGRASDLPLYKVSRELAKFLLLASADDAIPDLANPGFTKTGKPGTSQMLTLAKWIQDLEVEHIAPQSAADAPDWQSENYTELYSKELTDRVGNLTLLPRGVNASVGNRGWHIKRLYFRVLASTENDTADLLAKAEKEGVDLATPSKDLLERAKHLPHVRALANLPDDEDWSGELLRMRSKHIAERAWDRLAPWLGL